MGLVQRAMALSAVRRPCSMIDRNWFKMRNTMSPWRCFDPCDKAAMIRGYAWPRICVAASVKLRMSRVASTAGRLSRRVTEAVVQQFRDGDQLTVPTSWHIAVAER